MGEFWDLLPTDLRALVVSVVANKATDLINNIKLLNVEEKYHSDIENSLESALQKFSKNNSVRVSVQKRIGNVEKTLLPVIEGENIELTDEQESFLEIFEIEFAKTGYYAYLNHKVTKGIKDDTQKLTKFQEIDNYWGVDLPSEFYENLTQGLFDFQTIIGGRNDISELVYRNFKSGKSFDIISHSEDESIAFLLASIKKNNALGDFDDIYICKNVDGIQSLKKLSKRKTIIIPSYLLSDHRQTILNISYQVIGVNYYSSRVKSNEEIVEIPKYLDFEMTMAIENEMNKTHDDSSIISRKGQGVLTKLFRQIKSHSIIPSWVDQINFKYSIPAVLSGEWHDQDDWQKEYLKELGIIDYDEFCKELIKVSGEGDTFIYMTNGFWRVRDTVESFEVLYDKILPSQIDVFKNYAKEVLTDINPYSNLKGLEGFFAFRGGVRANINEQFKNGIFKVLIGIEHLKANDTNSRNLKTVRNEIIDFIFSTQDNHQIENIFYYIAKYIEAAPEQTVDFINQIINYQENVILSIFYNEKQPELLWALEGVSTLPEYFIKVIDILIKLHKIDPGGNLNRPLNSLKILLDLSFTTNINPRMRLQAIIKVLESIPEKYDELLKEILIYSRGRFINHKSKFKFGYKFSLQKQKITWPEYYEIIEQLIPVIIEAEVKSHKKAIFDLIYCLKKESRMSFLKALIQNNKRLALDTKFWKELIYYKEYKKTNKQTSKLQADEETLIDELISLCEKKKVDERKLWIFNQGCYAIIAAENSLDEFNDYKKIEEIVSDERNKIVREIFNTDKKEFIDLVLSNEEPIWVLQSFQNVASPDEAINTIIDFIRIKNQEAFKYIGNLITHFSKKSGIEWIEECYAIVSTTLENPDFSRSVLLHCLPSIEVSKFVSSKNIKGYWEQIRTGFYFENLEIKKLYMNSLFDVGRASDALYIFRFDTHELKPQFCLEILERASKFLTINGFELHVIEKLFRIVHKSNFEMELLANLELKYAEYLLAGYPKVGIPNLSKLYFTNPTELINVIKYKNTETDFYKMRHYRNILDNISRFPLTDDDETDKESIKKFINDSRQLIDSPECEGTLDFIIGGVLSKIPKNNYEPKDYVCELIEEYYSDKFAEGFVQRGKSFIVKGVGIGHLESFKNEIGALQKFKTRSQKSFPNTLKIIDYIINDLSSNVKSLERDVSYDPERQWFE